MDGIRRRKTLPVKVGNLIIGGTAPISVQTMANVSASDPDGVCTQVKRLAEAGAQLIRITVPSLDAAKAMALCKEQGVTVPLVADIHFDYRMAIEAAQAGADKIRINPGNIGDEGRVREVVSLCREKKIPIRIGVNGGSLEKEILAKYGSPTPDAMVQSAMGHVRILEKYDFRDIIVSIKSSRVADMIEANEKFASLTEYPMHLGVTEAGTVAIGRAKSAVGIGALLARGIGDTIRVSLTADPALEIREGKTLLRSLGLDPDYRMNLVACPTCGRTKIDLISLAETFEARAEREGLTHLPLTVAVMGCVVNGPGEARHANLGIAGGEGEGLLFEKGDVIGKYPEDALLDALIDRIKTYHKERMRTDGEIISRDLS